MSFARIPETGLSLVVSVDETRIVGEIDRDIRNAYLQLALVAIAVLLGAWMLGERLILRPIRVLTTMATRLKPLAIGPVKAVLKTSTAFSQGEAA